MKKKTFWSIFEPRSKFQGLRSNISIEVMRRGWLSVSSQHRRISSWQFHNDQSSLDDGQVDSRSFSTSSSIFGIETSELASPDCNIVRWGEVRPWLEEVVAGCSSGWLVSSSGAAVLLHAATDYCWLSVQLEMSMRPSDLRQQRHNTTQTRETTTPSPPSLLAALSSTCFSQVSYGSRRRCVICVY